MNQEREKVSIQLTAEQGEMVATAIKIERSHKKKFKDLLKVFENAKEFKGYKIVEFRVDSSGATDLPEILAEHSDTLEGKGLSKQSEFFLGIQKEVNTQLVNMGIVAQ